MDEKRKFQRIKNRQKVWCEGQDKKFQVESTDMSRGGIAIVANDAPKVGSQVKVSFVVPDGGNVSVNMEVVWSDKKAKNGEQVAAGLRVIDFENGQEAFNSFLAHRLSDQNEAIADGSEDKPDDDEEA
ncbi:MAG: PilZ domain-containing protein [Deltaproteobacteria bacterium]|nr:PilZ domain-containing protein [Deltaproteobacteria bacterium]